jgi:hypothetical protein
MGGTKLSFLNPNWKSDDFGYTWEKREGMFQLKIYKYQTDNLVLRMATHTVAI